MYPSGELKILATRKAALQTRIAARRWQCVEAAGELAKPVASIDGLISRWRRLPPLVRKIGTPVALLLMRQGLRRFGGGKLAGWIRGMPTILRTAGMFAKARA